MKIIQAGQKAVEELIKVAKEKIVDSKFLFDVFNVSGIQSYLIEGMIT